MAIYNEFGYITIDDARIDETCNAYFKWKDLNTYISNNSHRGINMPDAISEPMGCYCMGYLWNRGDEVGDATDPNTGRKIEFKATSRFEGDLSSFGPKCVFDNAVMLVSLEDELDESMKELIKTAIPDLITETPATPIAIAKYKKGIKCAGDILKNSMRQLLIDVVSETVKKSLFQ